jgi:hypothetical protein
MGQKELIVDKFWSLGALQVPTLSYLINQPHKCLSNLSFPSHLSFFKFKQFVANLSHSKSESDNEQVPMCDRIKLIN